MSQAQAPTEKMPAEGGLPPQIALVQMVAGYWVSQAVYVAAKLGLVDLLKDGPLDAEALAEASGTHAPTLQRLLRALASIGLLSQQEGGRFAVTQLGEALQTGPGSMRAMTLHLVEGPSWKAWGDLLTSVQTGETAFDRVNGASCFPFYAEHPESAAPFNQAMTEYSEAVSAEVTRAYDFSEAGTIVDVGGGHGMLLASILGAYSQPKGIVFDLPAVVAGAQATLEEQGLTDRCERIGGDFFQEVPAGDTYVLKAIIHDWNDEQSLAILKNIRRSIKPGGRVLLVEQVVPEGDGPHMSKFGDLHMLIMTGGRERTGAEYGALLADAGLRMTRVIPAGPLMSIVEAVAAE